MFPSIRKLHLSPLFKYVQVPPGEYRLSAMAAMPESAPGLLFLPSFVDVVVKSPLMTIKFSQVIFLKTKQFLRFF